MTLLNRLFAIALLLIGAASPALSQSGVQFQPGTVWGNDTGSARPGKASTMTLLFDQAFGSTRGSILERGAANWGLITPGTTGLPFVSNGAGADPSYQRLGVAGMLQGIANSILINPTGSTANFQNLAVPSCANDGAHALVYVNGSGLVCATLTTGGTVTSVVCDGVTITGAGTCPPRMGFANCTITASVASNNLTVALKDNAGADPSASSPCNVWFRSSTAAPAAASAIWVQRTVTAATSIVVNAGSTFGVANSTASCITGSSCPFRLWVTLVDTGSTAVLGLTNLTNAAGVRPLNQAGFLTTTACSACSGATAIGTTYTTAAQTTKPFVILGYMDWGSGLGTAGTYASGPTLIQTMAAGIPRPGEVLQTLQMTTTTQASSTGNTYGTTTTTGSTFVTNSITLTSSVNLVKFSAGFDAYNRATSSTISMFLTMYNATANVAVGPVLQLWGQSQQGNALGAITYYDSPGSVSAQTYTLRFKNSDNTTNMSVPSSSGPCSLVLEEVMG